MENPPLDIFGVKAHPRYLESASNRIGKGHSLPHPASRLCMSKALSGRGCNGLNQGKACLGIAWRAC